jgi:AraC family transcriptional regulator of adaptative response/methylated-DNA-[protein]-cysteine methyltransferase
MRVRSRTPRRPRTDVAAADAATAAVRWRAVLARDGAADGTFVFAVRTTGVYCRPSCPARRPLRANVAFFADGAAARAAGFRACKRCAPDAANSPDAERRALVVQVCRWLDDAERPPSLAELAWRSGYSPFHLQRTFRAIVGATPRAYAATRRAERLRAALADGVPVTAAMGRAGYGSSSRLHAAAERVLGMQPKRARRGGDGERIEFHTAACALGRVLVAATALGVCAVLLGDDDATLVEELAERFPRAERVAGDRAFAARMRAVLAVVDGDGSDPKLPFDVRGTAFQQRVWQVLTRIPRGRTIDYAGLAAELGMPRGARAVAAACAANPIAVLVPCHRVVRGDGALAGYRWGLARKRALLAREGARVVGEAKREDG